MTSALVSIASLVVASRCTYWTDGTPSEWNGREEMAIKNNHAESTERLMIRFSVFERFSSLEGGDIHQPSTRLAAAVLRQSYWGSVVGGS